MPKETIIAADVGGTNSRFLLYEINYDSSTMAPSATYLNTPPGRLLLNRKYENQYFDSFISVFKQFLADAYVSKPPRTACIAVAGPVVDNQVRFTNRGWVLDGEIISETLGIQTVKLINDFVANGYALLTLNEETECKVLQKAPKQPNAPIACIGAGTGLGECFLTPDSNGVYSCFPSEGGHACFAPRNDLEFELLKYLKVKFSQKHRVSVERIASGGGLVNIYEYLATIHPDRVDPHIHEQFITAGDKRAAVIAKNRNNNELCQKTMEIFVTAYGSEAGVAALKWLPFGGLYLTGGITPKNIDLLTDKDGPFLSAFLDKGRVSGMLCSIPIYAVMTEDLGVRGAHLLAFRLLRDLYYEIDGSPSKRIDNEFKELVKSRVKHNWTFILSLSFTSALLLTAAFTFGRRYK
mmetsp:Transcript_23127/g.21023  ORF Transcript_23127/g.21023 Transcript_23127/m.21023 type:complete len:409 (-) Transcript_23127:71-1297(-)